LLGFGSCVGCFEGSGKVDYGRFCKISGYFFFALGTFLGIALHGLIAWGESLSVMLKYDVWFKGFTSVLTKLIADVGM